MSSWSRRVADNDNGYIFYNTTSRKLLYDANGIGAGVAPLSSQPSIPSQPSQSQILWWWPNASSTNQVDLSKFCIGAASR